MTDMTPREALEVELSHYSYTFTDGLADELLTALKDAGYGVFGVDVVAGLVFGTDLMARLIAYINRMEEGMCGEYHGDVWPDCDQNDEGNAPHGEGRALLTELGGTPSRSQR